MPPLHKRADNSWPGGIWVEIIADNVPDGAFADAKFT